MPNDHGMRSLFDRIGVLMRLVHAEGPSKTEHNRTSVAFRTRGAVFLKSTSMAMKPVRFTSVIAIVVFLSFSQQAFSHGLKGIICSYLHLNFSIGHLFGLLISI